MYTGLWGSKHINGTGIFHHLIDDYSRLICVFNAHNLGTGEIQRIKQKLRNSLRRLIKGISTGRGSEYEFKER